MDDDSKREVGEAFDNARLVASSSADRLLAVAAGGSRELWDSVQREWPAMKGRLARQWRVLQEGLVSGVQASEAVSRQHVQPPPWLLIVLIFAATCLSLLVYGQTMAQLYGNLERSVSRANTIYTVLSEGELQPFSPLPGRSKPNTAFRDPNRPTEQNVFEYLRALGVIDPSVRYQQISVTPAASDPVNRIVAYNLTKVVQKCTDKPAEGQLSTVKWLVCIAMERKFKDLPNCKPGDDLSRCRADLMFETGITRALAATPGKENALAIAVVDANGSCKGVFNARSGGLSASAGAKPVVPDPDCLALQDDVRSAPSFWSYAFTFNPDKGPTINDIARTVLIGTGVIPRLVPDAKPEAAPSAASSANIAVNGAVEKVIRASLARVLTDAQVKQDLSWLAGLRGYEQFLMLWVLLVLLFLLGARAASRMVLRQEIQETTKWFKQTIEGIYGSHLPDETGDRPRNKQVAQVRKLQREIETKIDSPEKAALGEGAAKIRSDSLALFMLNKAVRRMLLTDPQPELFRGYCQDQRELVEDSAWFLRYLARALPALGFIGTVHGIMIALGDADLIVRANNVDQMAAAMASLTTPLSLAFATTFIALVFGLVTSYVTDLELAKERTLLATLEAELIECVDPAERYSQPAVT